MRGGGGGYRGGNGHPILGLKLEPYVTFIHCPLSEVGQECQRLKGSEVISRTVRFSERQEIWMTRDSSDSWKRTGKRGKPYGRE